MKNFFKNSLLIKALALVVFACQPDAGDGPELLNQEIEEVVAVIHETFLATELEGGSEEEAFRIDEEDFAGVYSISRDALEKPAESQVNRRGYGMVFCLRNLGLDDDKFRDVRRLFWNFDNCKGEAAKAHQEDLRKLLHRVENARKELVELVRSGELTREEFQRRLFALRNAYNDEFKNLKEKHAEALKPCLRTFIGTLKRQLSEDEWIRFRTCMSK